MMESQHGPLTSESLSELKKGLANESDDGQETVTQLVAGMYKHVCIYADLLAAINQNELFHKRHPVKKTKCILGLKFENSDWQKEK